MTCTGFQSFLTDDMIVLFVPTNPPPKSWDNGHYFSSIRSTAMTSLWYQLHHAGFGSEINIYPECEADAKIFGNPDNRLGIIDLVPDVVTANPNDLTNQDIEKGRANLEQVIHDYKPKIVCFVGKGAYGKFNSLRDTRSVEYGFQEEKIEDSQVFVACFPSTSSDLDAPVKIEILKSLHTMYQRFMSSLEILDL